MYLVEGVQSSKIIEALLVLTIPIVIRDGFTAFDDLARSPFHALHYPTLAKVPGGPATGACTLRLAVRTLRSEAQLGNDSE